MHYFHRLIARMPSSMRRSFKRLPKAGMLRDWVYGATPRGSDPLPGSLRPVVYLPTWLQWDVMQQRPQYLLQAFAKLGHEVWFVDPRLEKPVTVAERVHLVPSLGPVPSRGVIIYVHYAPLATMFDRFESPAVIYDILDDLSIYDADEIGLPAEMKVRNHHGSLMASADAVIVSNPVLAERHRMERSDLLLVENGVDMSRFTIDGPVAPELSGKSGLVGYHGAIAPWFDFDLAMAVANSRPSLEFVFVGPIDPRVEDQAALLMALPNVTYHPEHPVARIAEFVRGFSVGLVPFVVDELTQAVTPLKMYEYMACGIPVVTTPLPACVEHPAVEAASDPISFAERIDLALKTSEGQRMELVAHAEKATWSTRLDPLEEWLEKAGLRRVS